MRRRCMKRSVIFLNRYFFPDHSATSQLLSDLAFETAKSGMPVTVITGQQIYDDSTRRLLARQSVEGVAVRRVWSTRFGRGQLWGRALDYLSFYLSASVALLFILRRGDLVVAKTDPPMIGLPVALIAALRGAGHAHWVQDIFPEIAAREFFWLAGLPCRALTAMRNAALRSAAFVVVLSGAMRRHLIANGIAAEKISVIPNWFDGERVRPLAAADNPLRTDWGLRDAFVVGYSGNLGRVHDADTFLDAAAILQSDPEVVFCFVGGGAKREALEARARRRGLTNFRFKPYQAQDMLAHSLTLPDVHLVSLRPGFEGLVYPSKMAGIAAAGRAVVFVGDPDGGLARSIREARIGVVAPCGHGAALARQLRDLKNDVALRRELGANARDYFESTFTRSKSLAAWADLLSRARTPRD